MASVRPVTARIVRARLRLLDEASGSIGLVIPPLSQPDLQHGPEEAERVREVRRLFALAVGTGPDVRGYLHQPQLLARRLDEDLGDRKGVLLESHQHELVAAD